MKPFQKEALIRTQINPSMQDFARNLFHALTISGTNFESLVIPVLNLELENVIPTGNVADFIKQVNIDRLAQTAIVFDIYIPSKKWVANIKTSLHSNNTYLSSAVNDSVAKMLQQNEISNMIPLSFDKKPYDLQSILSDAVMTYFNRNNITHPLDFVPALRHKDTNGMIFPSEKIESFIYQINK